MHITKFLYLLISSQKKKFFLLIFFTIIGSFLEMIITELESNQKKERECFLPSFITNDWKAKAQAMKDKKSFEFFNPKDFKKVLKKKAQENARTH